MSWATAVVLIVLISAIAGVMRARSHGGGRLRHRHGEAPPSPREKELENEVESLRERIQVLERIATDGNSLDASETRRIAAEIEALRDKSSS
ncbi:hypothetical protein [Altererythrobacter sp.]|uniref:hypothetical protein n=1 Tax=Altererythrobacter sp. TaxID=1872480 RepID=UPI003D089822